MVINYGTSDEVRNVGLSVPTIMILLILVARMNMFPTAKMLNAGESAVTTGLVTTSPSSQLDGMAPRSVPLNGTAEVSPQ
jgi:hypothetical protein